MIPFTRTAKSSRVRSALCALAVAAAVLIQCIPIPNLGSNRVELKTERSSFAEFDGELGNILAGEYVPYGPDSEYKNIIVEEVPFEKMKSFDSYNVRAFLPKKLRAYEWNRAMLFTHLEAWDSEEPFSMLLQSGISNEDSEYNKRDEVGMIFDNFSQDAADTATAIAGGIGNLITGGALSEMVNDTRSNEFGAAGKMSIFVQRDFNPDDPSSLRVVDDNWTGDYIRFSADTLEKYRKEYEFSSLRVRMYLYAVIITSERRVGYNPRKVYRTNSAGEVEERTEYGYYKVFRTYANPPQQIAAGEYTIYFD
jgi:hypothetical protein